MRSSFLAPYLRSNQFLSLAGNITVSGLTIVSTSLLFRGLPTADIGTWVFFLTLTGFGEAFRQGYLSTGLIRGYAGATPGRQQQVLGSAWVLALGLTLALAGLTLAARWSALAHVASLELFVRWFPLTFLLTLPSFMASCRQQAEQQFGRLLVLRLLTQGTFIGGIAGLMLSGRLSLASVVGCHLAAAAVTSAVALLAGWSGLRVLRCRTAGTTRELAHFGKFSVGSYIGAYLLRSSDTVLINLLLGPAALAVYNLAQRFLEVIEIPLRSFMATAIPRLAAAMNQQNRPLLALVFQQNAGLLTWLLLPLVLGTVLLAEVPVYLVGGSQYVDSEAANVLRMAVALALFYPIDRFTGVTLDVLGLPHLNLYKVLLMVVVNVAGDWAGIRLCGNLYGVAFASLPTMLTGFVFGYLLLKRELPLSLAGTLRVGLMEGRTMLRRLTAAAHAAYPL
ncbi:lipopolysaccharide biosynthesis protein [Hymenobacter rigui]|uniref:Lipopolysaccharide biosynthesis protein n=1 Tax=Hymenobacter rigui TaxID=334424 RepID=A0A428KRG1_9BACT|nr:oligosaccharide flippase family protein [Hymenobacter rigui]RSK49058.1 lipopolysaccharide biosynthesis protein [Hymenobacter rigui]